MSKHINTAQALKKSPEKEKIGVSRAGLTSKIHALVNENGQAIRFLISGGNQADCTIAEKLLPPMIRKERYILGDRGYDSNQIRGLIQEGGSTAVIPGRKNRLEEIPYDKEIYKNRNQVERFFQRLKNFRRISTRYDKLTSSFLSFVYLASALLAIPKFSPIV